MTGQGPQTASASAHPEDTGEGQHLRHAKPNRTSWWTRAGLLLPVMVLLGLFGVAVIRHQQTLAIGTALARRDAPPVPALTLPALDGPPISLAALRGHPVILNYWASWCVPCRDEAPLGRTSHDRGTGFLRGRVPVCDASTSSGNIDFCRLGGYYGGRMAGYLLAVSYVAMAIAGFLVDLLFRAAGLVLLNRHAIVAEAHVTFNYTTGLNVVFLGLAAILVWRFLLTGGPEMLKMMNSPMASHKAPHA